MVKHTRTIRRQNADELFKYVWQFYGVGAYRVKKNRHDLIFNKFQKKSEVLRIIKVENPNDFEGDYTGKVRANLGFKSATVTERVWKLLVLVSAKV